MIPTIQRYTYRTAHPPLLDFGQLVGEEYPWRVGRCLLVRAPFTRKSVVLGFWTGKQPQSEDEDGPMLTFRPMEFVAEEFDGAGKVSEEASDEERTPHRS